MASAVSPNIPQAPCINNCTNFNTLNPEPAKTSQKFGDGPNVDQTPVDVSRQSSSVIFNLNSYSETELNELKDKFISDLERIRSLVKQVEARELELAQVEDVDLHKQENIVDKTSKIIGQKRTMPITPDRETKRKRLVKTTELNSERTRKGQAAMMSKCGVILEKLVKHRHGWVFNEPVDVVALGLRNYHQVVKRPMDLGTVKSKLGKRVYRNPLDFAKDVRLTFDNAMLYNRKGEEVHTMATVLLDMFDKLFDPAYEKFKVERQRVTVPQQKFSKPLAEFTRSQVAVSSQRETEKPLQKHPQAALPKKICKETAIKAVSKKKRTVLEAMEKPRKRREMSIKERVQLGLVLQEFGGEYLDEIVQIVAKRNSKLTTPDGDGEIELDVHALDSETMWDLNRFVRVNLMAEQKNKVI